MNQYLSYVGDQPLDEEAVREHATRWIRAKLGQTSFVDKLMKKGNQWEIDIGAEFPKVVMDSVRSKPKNALWFYFPSVARIVIDATNGDVLEKPGYWPARTRIKSELERVYSSVEMAITKVGAEPLSQLPFGEHMHSPMMDILSWLLFHHKLEFNEDESVEVQGSTERMSDYLDRLESVGLIRKEENVAIPGNELIEIFGSNIPDHEKIKRAMAVFFSKGFSDIESIRQVLGPYLRLGRIIYEDSVEISEINPLSYETIRIRMLETPYGRMKEFKVPRYLVQLSNVGLIDSVNIHGITAYAPNQHWFQQVQNEKTILAPVRESLIMR